MGRVRLGFGFPVVRPRRRELVAATGQPTSGKSGSRRTVLVVSCGFCPRSRARLRRSAPSLLGGRGRHSWALRYGVGLSPSPAGINSALPSRVGGELLPRRERTRVTEQEAVDARWSSSARAVPVAFARGFPGRRVPSGRVSAGFLTRCMLTIRVRGLIVNDKLTGCVVAVKDNCFSPGRLKAGEKAPHLHYEYE